MSEPPADKLRRKQRLAAAQGGTCPWCNLPLPEDMARTQVDHIIPLGRGGPNLQWNRQLLHEQCNYAKGSKLTPEAEELAAQHGVILYEPLPNIWPGSTKPSSSGKPNPYQAIRDAARDAARRGIRLAPAPMRPPPPPPPPKVKVTIRKVYEVECHTCQCIIDAPDSYAAAVETRRTHAATHRNAAVPA